MGRTILGKSLPFINKEDLEIQGKSEVLIMNLAKKQSYHIPM